TLQTGKFRHIGHRQCLGTVVGRWAKHEVVRDQTERYQPPAAVPPPAATVSRATTCWPHCASEARGHATRERSSQRGGSGGSSPRVDTASRREGARRAPNRLIRRHRTGLAHSASNARRFHSPQFALEFLDLVTEAGRGL